MINATSSIAIARRPGIVYDFVVVRFFDNYPRWSREVVELEPLGSRRVEHGTRGRQVRIDQGRRSESEFEVTHIEPGRSVCFDGRRAASFRIRYHFEAAGDASTRLHFEFRLERVDLFMRPFEKLIRLAIQDGADRTVRNIKHLVEQEH